MKGHSTRPKVAYPSSNGTLVIRLQIKDAMVGRALIDNGWGVNILFKEAVVRMGILNEVTRRTIVQTLRGTSLNTIRTIRLMVRAKPSKHMMTFHVMDSLSPYNVILGQEWLYAMRKIPFKDRILPRYPGTTPSRGEFNNREIWWLVPRDETPPEENRNPCKPFQVT